MKIPTLKAGAFFEKIIIIAYFPFNFFTYARRM